MGALKGLSTIGTFLMNLDTAETPTKLVDITSYPDLGGEISKTQGYRYGKNP